MTSMRTLPRLLSDAQLARARDALATGSQKRCGSQRQIGRCSERQIPHAEN